MSLITNNEQLIVRANEHGGYRLFVWMAGAGRALKAPPTRPGRRSGGGVVAGRGFEHCKIFHTFQHHMLSSALSTRTPSMAAIAEGEMVCANVFIAMLAQMRRSDRDL